MLFHCSLLATGLCNLTNTPYEINGGVPASYQYSKWKISNCSPEQTQAIITNLDVINSSLPVIAQALERGTETAPYKIFFKHIRELPLIQQVFNNLAAGEEVRAFSISHPLNTAPPEFLCTNATDFTASYVDLCNDEDLDALTFTDQPYVVLCPGFWDYLYPSLVEKLPRPMCPSPKSDSLPDDDSMLWSKTAIIIHELIHLYTENQIMPEIYSMRKCTRLSTTKAAHNANNYAFFAMSIIMNCMDWPAGLKRWAPDIRRASGSSKNLSSNTMLHDKFDADPSVLLSALRSSTR